jgi:sugar lactone lactonase YvrE
MNQRLMSAARVAAHTQDTLGESPVWNGADGQLYWVDIRRCCLHSFDPGSGETQTWAFSDGLITGVLLRADGSLLLTRHRDVRVFPRETMATGTCFAASTLHQLIAFPDNGEDHRTNEVKCDPAGHLWCGTMRDFGKDTTGALYRVAPSWNPRGLREKVRIPNALDFSPDGKWVYFADTSTGCIERARFDEDAGITGEWSVLVAAGSAPGKPDGLAIDHEGCLWNARFGGACVARFDPDGQLMQTLALPASQPTSCAFGGAELDTLFVTTARQGMTPEQIEREPVAGDLLACEPGVRGLPARRFNG